MYYNVIGYCFVTLSIPDPQRRRTVRTEESDPAVERSIEEDPNESIFQLCTAIGALSIRFMKDFDERS